MTKFMAGLLGLALLATPLCGSAQGTGTADPIPAKKEAPQTKNAGSQGFPTLCEGKPAGTLYTGTVIGLGANWFKDNDVPISFNAGGNKYTGTALWTVDDTAGQLLSIAMTTAYTSQTNVILYCSSNTYASAWLGQGAP